MHEFSEYFGLDGSLFGLSTQDYLLQSIRPLFVPLAIVLLAGLVLLRAHAVLMRQIARHPDRRFWLPATGLLAVVGAGLFVTGWVKYAEVRPSDAELVLTPVSTMLGVGMVSYAVLIDGRRRLLEESGAAPAPSTPMGPPRLSVILVSVLIAVGLVWLVANYAEIKGREEAEFVHEQLEFRPGVVVYSAARLHIGGTGVEETALPDPESAYRFRYDGLKLLFHAEGRYFLVPASWSLSDGTTILLQENDELRLEFVRPPG